MIRDSFFGLNVASSGLYSSQRSLSVVSHNLSNASTEGYSRQRAVQEANRPMIVYDGSGMMGTGSNIISVERIRDDYLDYKYWSEKDTHGEWDAKRMMLGDIESVFNEPSDSGFNTTLNEFFEGLQELAKDPSSDSVRSVVRERGVTLAKYFNTTASHLEKIQEDINNNLRAKIEEVNSLASQISEVNKQITNEELLGSIANDLRDRRTVLVDKMSKLVNIEADETVRILPSGGIEKKFAVTISGKAIVDHFDVSPIEIKVREEKLNDEDVEGLYDIGWEDGNELIIRGGEIRGFLDVRDGKAAQNGSPNFKGAPFYIKKLNDFVRTFAVAINEGYIDMNNNGFIESNEDNIGHVDGYKRNSVLGDETSGIRFFTMIDEDGFNINSNDFIDEADEVEDDIITPINERISAIMNQYQNVTAKNFAVSKDLFDNLDNISVADAPEENGNIEVLNEFLNVRHNKELFAEGAPEDFMKALISTLGIDTQQAIRITDNQQNIVEQITNRRLSDSGVSIDEEMSNLVKFQHVYNASAKMISTMSELYDTLINRTGV